MSNDIKEKYERVCAIKDRAISLVETQLEGDISQVDAKELGEVADIAKDMAEIMKLCSETEYYSSINKAMEEAAEEDKATAYMEKYIPEYAYTRNYMPRMDYTDYGRMHYTIGRGGRPSSRNYGNYASNGNSGGSSGGSSGSRGSSQRSYMEDPYMIHDDWDGRSWEARRNYMYGKEENKNDSESMKDLEKYMKSLGEDIVEMVDGMTTSEKNMLKQRLSTLVSKIN